MDQKMLDQLYKRYSREIYLYLFSLCKSKELSEDLMHETFLKALFSLDEHHSNIRAWLYMVARNLMYNEYKRKKRKEEYESSIRDSVMEENALLHIIQSEEKRSLYEALMKVEQKKREVLILQFYSGLSQKEIASILHLSLENIRILAYRGKRELKKYMEEASYEIP